MRKPRLLDLAAAAPLIAFYTFAIAGLALQCVTRLRAEPMSIPLGLWLVLQAVTAIYFGEQVVLFVLRRLPAAKTDGFAARAAAVIGAYGGFALIVLPRTELNHGWLLLSVMMGIIGTAASVIVLLRLGRSFSIFPQARGLTMLGPYRFVRHPLYLAELVAALGVMVQFRQPWAAAIVVVSFAFQLMRIGYEERILTRAYPEYAGYAARTARLIPGLY